MEKTNRRALKGHKECINCIDATTSSRGLIASGSDDHSIRIWDIRTNRAVKCITQCFDSPVEAAKFNVADDNVLYAASGKGLYAFDLRTDGILIKTPVSLNPNASTDDINAIAVDPAGEFLAVADDCGIVTILNVNKLGAYQPKRFCGGHTNLVNAIAFNPIKQSSFFSGGFDCLICSWDTSATGKSPDAVVDMSKLGHEGNDEFSLKTINPPFVQALSYVYDGQAVAVALGDGSVSIKDCFEI